MQTFKDPAIREMLRRRHAAVPPLSDDFEEKLFAAYEQRKQLQKRRNVRRLILWPSIAAAATVALLLVLHIAKQPTNTMQLAKTQLPSINIISSPKEPTSPAPNLLEVSSEKKHKTYRRKSRVITQEEVTNNSTATAVEENVEEKSLAVVIKGTVVLSSHLNDIRQRVRDNAPSYNLAIAEVNNSIYD